MTNPGHQVNQDGYSGLFKSPAPIRIGMAACANRWW